MFNNNTNNSGISGKSNKASFLSNKISQISNIWENLRPELKRKLTLGGIGLLVLSIALSMYYVKTSRNNIKTDNVTQSPLAQEKVTKKFYVGDSDTDKIASLSRKYEEQLKRIEMEKKGDYGINLPPDPLDNFANNNKTNINPNANMGPNTSNTLTPSNLPYPKPETQEEKQQITGKKKAKPYNNIDEYQPPKVDLNQYGDNNPPKKQPVIEFKLVNGIEMTTIQQQDKKTEESAKKTAKINYLPTSTVMPVTLITGVYAPTMAKGMQNPYPVVMRVNDLSFLPNAVRKNITGCFISGESYGSLAEERAMIRLLKLSCISDSQSKVIDKPIKGYVAGEDGIVGLQGKVVSKQGKALAMAFVASFLQGVGQGLSQANSSVNTTVFGTTTQSVDAGSLMKYGAGTGFSESFKMLAEFYMSIVKETAPVIEVKGKRKVEAILTEGLELTMDDYVWEGIKDAE